MSNLYRQMLNGLQLAASTFLPGEQDVSDELKDDFETILEVHDISTWRSNIDGRMKSVPDLIVELQESIADGDKQKCIESVAMLRGAIADLEGAFSNAKDSMERLIVQVRDGQ